MKQYHYQYIFVSAELYEIQNSPDLGTAATTGNFFVSIDKYGLFSVLRRGKNGLVVVVVVVGAGVVVVVVGVDVVGNKLIIFCFTFLPTLNGCFEKGFSGQFSVFLSNFLNGTGKSCKYDKNKYDLQLCQYWSIISRMTVLSVMLDIRYGDDTV